MTGEIIDGFNPCPFCGSKKDFLLSSDELFYQLQDKYGDACLSLTCDKCKVTMYEHTYTERDYLTRVKILMDKWNSRTEGENE